MIGRAMYLRIATLIGTSIADPDLKKHVIEEFCGLFNSTQKKFPEASFVRVANGSKPIPMKSTAATKRLVSKLDDYL